MPRDTKHRGGARESKRERTITAQVIVRSRSGKRISGDVAITSRTITDYVPSPEDAEAATLRFRELGFEIGPLVGISFSITALASKFEETFGVKLRVDDRGAVARAGSEPPPGGLELPAQTLPPELAKLVVTVTFAPPAELYGPSGSLFI